MVPVLRGRHGGAHKRDARIKEGRGKTGRRSRAGFSEKSTVEKKGSQERTLSFLNQCQDM